MRQAVAVVVLSACGRLAFDPRAERTDAAPDRPNRVFITAANMPGGFGGVDAADAICMAEAAGAGLEGTFVAFVATAARPDPRARLTGSRAWSLVDGTPIGNTVESMLDGFEVYNPIAMLADGTPLIGNHSTWTGTSQDGIYEAARTCNDWTSTSMGDVGQGNNVRNASWSGGSFVGCDGNRRLVCFETGHVADMAPVVTTGRLAFITLARRTSALDVVAADALCATEGTAAGLPGTYRAALTTSTASVASRFTVDTRPFIRRDGTFVAPGDVLFTGTNLTSFVHQLSDGSYTRDNYWTGVATNPSATAPAGQTCNDWTSFSGSLSSESGQASHTIGSSFWGASNLPCDAKLHFLCVQD